MWLALVLVAWIVVLGLFMILRQPDDAKPGKDAPNPVNTAAAQADTGKRVAQDTLMLPTSTYPDDKYAKEPRRAITTILESMVVRSEDSHRGKVLQYLRKGTVLQYHGVRTRSLASLELAGKRVDGYWLKVNTDEHEGWMFSPGTDYQDE